jgi:hypothetical protein
VYETREFVWISCSNGELNDEKKNAGTRTGHHFILRLSICNQSSLLQSKDVASFRIRYGFKSTMQVHCLFAVSVMLGGWDSSYAELTVAGLRH